MEIEEWADQSIHRYPYVVGRHASAQRGSIITSFLNA
jgi:hypothetical protein